MASQTGTLVLPSSAQGRVAAWGCSWVVDGCQACCSTTWVVASGIHHGSGAATASQCSGTANDSLVDEACVVMARNKGPCLWLLLPPQMCLQR